MSNGRETEGLKSLGKKTEYRQDYAPEVLETFQNKHPENDYWVQFNCPEFTSLCPITGQLRFAFLIFLTSVWLRARASSSIFSLSVIMATSTRIASIRL